MESFAKLILNRDFGKRKKSSVFLAFLFILLWSWMVKVPAQDIITTVVGNNTAGFSGDGENALFAQINSPMGITVDDKGYLYFTDTQNHRIRKIDPNGNISTVAGNGNQGYAGDGGMATTAQLNKPSDLAVDKLGNLYIADTGNHLIRKVDSSGKITTIAGNSNQGYSGDGEYAIDAKLNSPKAITLDNVGNLYIADTGNHVIRKIDIEGNITTISDD